MRGNGNTSGVALVEVYDLNQGVDSKLANLSTRAFVSTGDNIVIAGFLLSGDGTNGINGIGGPDDDRVIVRGIGPSLAPAIFPAAAVLADPTLELRDANGTLIVSNNDWQDNAVQAAEITAAGLAPSNSLESAIAATLPPGLYTALLAGRNNGTGIGVVEIYDRGPEHACAVTHHILLRALSAPKAFGADARGRLGQESRAVGQANTRWIWRQGGRAAARISEKKCEALMFFWPNESSGVAARETRSDFNSQILVFPEAQNAQFPLSR